MKPEALFILPALAITLSWSAPAKAQIVHAGRDSAASVPLQPLMDQVRRIEAALDFFGQPLNQWEKERINAAFSSQNSGTAISSIEKVLDRHVLAVVTINPESRVDAKRGAAPAELVQHETRLFLVKVINSAGITAPLAVESPNSGAVYRMSTESSAPDHSLTSQDVRERWADIAMFNKPPMDERLSGLSLEYRIMTVSSRDSGQRAAGLIFNVGQGTQDLGFLDDISILFRISPAHRIALHVIDANGQPTMASFIFRDSMGRVYPHQLKRLAPDFFFQPQVYRADGESIRLPPGSYTVVYTGGPEYITETRKFNVTGKSPTQLVFHLKRWIDPVKYGWYSGDDHIHPAGCAHYDNPSEGVSPGDMERQVRGEHLNVGATLVWGPCFYYQSRFFQGRRDQTVSTKQSLLHYDLEVSGFPSSHAGHLVLLNLKSLTYPGTKHIEDWPTWDLPVLRWAKSQGAVVGFAHSGRGLEVDSNALPNYLIPPFDGIGANEYIVDVTYPHLVDFISAGNTPSIFELNIWYHTLNVGFRTRLSGETDFPCIYDNRVGIGRTYVKFKGPLTFDNYTKAIQDGEAYVSDGLSHLMDFEVKGTAMGTHGSQVNLTAPGAVLVGVTVAAYLPVKPDTSMNEFFYERGVYLLNNMGKTNEENGAAQIQKGADNARHPYWSLEKARIGTTRDVSVEVVVNGEPVASRKIVADGTVQKLHFNIPITKSSWVAVRILPSSHTDPVFILVGGKPIRASRRSAEWCLRSVNQCWTQKSKKISAREMPAAMKTYDHAREVYRKLISESSDQ